MPKIEKDSIKVRDANGNWKYIPAVGGAPKWQDVTGKPFSTLGDGLEVDENGVLSAPGGGGGGTVAKNAVLYTAQELTDEQQAQARANIGAGTSDFDGDYNKLTNRPSIPSAVEVDETLTQSGSAADAEVVGEGFAALNTELKNKQPKGDYLTSETDPTVPAWAKSPTKPTYTAAEVGALPDTTVIPTVPTVLPNPHKLTFTGAVSGEYDGSSALTVDIPQGGGGSDSSLGITAATVGQIAKITAVENGVPTAWEAVDLPSGGNPSNGELLFSAEASDVAAFSQSFDTKNYDKFLFFIGGTKGSSATSITRGTFCVGGMQFVICYYTSWLSATNTSYPNGCIAETLERVTDDIASVMYDQFTIAHDAIVNNFQGNSSLSMNMKQGYLKGNTKDTPDGIALTFSEAVSYVKVAVYGYY